MIQKTKPHNSILQKEHETIGRQAGFYDLMLNVSVVSTAKILVIGGDESSIELELHHSPLLTSQDSLLELHSQNENGHV